MKLQTVHVRVNDAATGQPTPVRVRFTDAEGKYYAPLGRLTDFATGPNQDVGGSVRLDLISWAFVEGSFEINLPPGMIHIEIRKGLEYLPISQTIQLAQGKLALRFTVERFIDMPAQGWFSGDGRCHFLSPHAALLEAQAEDVRVVNLLACQTVGPGEKTSLANILEFSGQKPALEASGYLVAVNTHNVHPEQGSFGLLNCHRVVYPLTLGGPSTRDDFSVVDWCDQCHRKKGLVVWTSLPVGGKSPTNALLGKIDAYEIAPSSGAIFDCFEPWYDLLNAGWKLPLIGSSAKDSNTTPLGAIRTYACLQPGEEFGYGPWIEAVRAGRTFVTNGPLIILSVIHGNPGTLIKSEGAEKRTHVKAETLKVGNTQKLELVINGKIVVTEESDILVKDLALHAGSWIAARCQDLKDPQRFAHTSPFWVPA